jgi:uncharacterized protein YuzE
MKIRFDKNSDVIYIQFSENQVAESDEGKPGIILDYDSHGSIVGIEILRASKTLEHANSVVYEMA